MLKTETYFVAFIDILGFSEIIKNYDKGLLPNILVDLKSAVDNATSFLKMNLSDPNDPLSWKQHLKVNLFSDCLCAAIPANLNFNDLFHNFIFFSLYISTYQNLLMEKGFFARGGISIGSFYSDENMIFSGALVESVELEKKAIFPRILLSKRLIEEVTTIKDKDDEILKELLAKDTEEMIFLNNFNIANCTNLILSKNFQKIEKDNPSFALKIKEKMKISEDFEVKESKASQLRIRSNINKSLVEFQNDEKIFKKYFWLKHFFDWSNNESNNKLSIKKFEVSNSLVY